MKELPFIMGKSNYGRICLKRNGKDERIWVWLTEDDQKDYSDDVNDNKMRFAVAADTTDHIAKGTVIPFRLNGVQCPVVNLDNHEELITKI